MRFVIIEICFVVIFYYKQNLEVKRYYFIYVFIIIYNNFDDIYYDILNNFNIFIYLEFYYY